MSKRISLKQTAADNGYESVDDMIEAVALDGATPACCDEGCTVEPDGTCQHGNPSVLLVMGLI